MPSGESIQVNPMRYASRITADPFNLKKKRDSTAILSAWYQYHDYKCTDRFRDNINHLSNNK